MFVDSESVRGIDRETSSEASNILLRHVDLEGSIKYGSLHITGSDAWLEQMMNARKEREAISRFLDNFLSQNNQLDESQQHSIFSELLDRWLFAQFRFCLSENGCEKYLKIQPDYYFTITQDDYGHCVTPNDISQFGDLSKKYIEENERVGEGLYNLYHHFAVTKNCNLWAGIVSPTEEYQAYGSKTDVINLWKSVTKNGQTTEAVGKYLVLDRVLTTAERRFIHNLFFWFKPQTVYDRSTY